jgi:hypothetical protein
VLPLAAAHEILVVGDSCTTFVVRVPDPEASYYSGRPERTAFGGRSDPPPHYEGTSDTYFEGQ